MEKTNAEMVSLVIDATAAISNVLIYASQVNRGLNNEYYLNTVAHSFESLRKAILELQQALHEMEVI